jgi:4'-phosphopantetheinyl transferase
VHVDVWFADLDALPSRREVLSRDEIERAERFRFEHHRERFIRCRAWLRQLLAEALDRNAAVIEFRYGAQGKPEIDDLHFNVSHSANIAVIALSREQPIGIDVESIDGERDVVALANTAFSVEERAVLATMTHEDQIAAFFRGWTRKEAYLKLLGTGFSRAPDSFTISLSEEPICFIGDYALRDLPTRAGFACALATHRGWPAPRVRGIA